MYSFINKTLLLTLFILTQSTGAFATEFVDEVSIFVYGDASYMEVCFNALAMIFASDAFKDMTYVASGIFLAYAGWEIVKSQSLDFVIKQGTLYATIGILVLNTNAVVTVKVFDKRADHGMMNYVDFNGNPIPTFTAIANVPYIIGLFAGSASYMRYALVEITDTAFSPIQDTSYTRIGFMQNFITLRSLISKSNFDNSEKLQDFDKKISTYIAQCILEQIAPSNPSIVDNMKNPKNGDLLSFIDPTNVGIDSSMTISYGSLGTMSCESFYTNQIAAKAKDASDELFAALEAMEKPVSVSSISSSLADTFKTKTTSTVLAGVSDLQAYVTNVATSTSSLAKALNSHQIGVDMSTTANNNLVASKTATASLQLSGVGQWEWLATILPHAIYFMMGIVYVAGIFPLLFVLAFRQFGLILSYGKSILTLELISYSLSIVHNATTYFSQHDAANKLAFLASKGNAGSANNLPMHLDYLATMTGTAGVIGVTVALALPALIMKGEISGMLGALGSFGGRYNNSPEAISALLEQILQKNMVNDQQRRDGSAESSLGEQTQAQKIKAGMDRSAQTYAAIHAASNQSDYLQGASRSAVNQVGNTIGLGSSGTTNSDAINSGRVTGMQQGINMQETAKMDGNKNFFEGVRGQIAKGFGTTEGMGREMVKEGLTSESLKQIGRSQGAKSLAGENAALNADTATGLTENDGTVNNIARKGMFRNSRIMSEKTMGTGMGNDQSENEWGNIRKQSTGNFQSQFADAKGFVSGAMNGDNLKDGYAQGIESGSAKKASATNEYGSRINTSTALSSGVAEGAQNAGADIGSTKALKAYGTDSLSNASKNLTATKLASIMGASKEIDSRGLDSAMNLTAQASEAKQASDFQTTTKQNERFGSARNAAIISANKGVDDSFATFQGETKSGRINEDGSLTNAGIQAGMIDTMSKNAPSLNRAKNFASSEARSGAIRSMAESKYGKDMTKKQFEQFKKDEGWENVENMSATEFANELFGRQGTVFASHAQIAGKDGSLYTLAFSENGATSKRQSGSSSIDDNSHKSISGSNTENIQGLNIKNPFQALVHYATGGALGDTGEHIIGGAVIGVGTALTADQALTGGAGRKATIKSASDRFHKMRGHEQGIGTDGKKYWNSTEDFQAKGYTKNSDGIWEHPNNQNLSGRVPSNIAATNPTTAGTTKYNATPITTPNSQGSGVSSQPMDTSLNNLHNSSTNPTHIQGENPLAPHSGGGKFGKILTWTLTAGSVSLMADELKEKVTAGDYSGATLDIAQTLDPTISGVQTIRETTSGIKEKIQHGDYLGAAGDAIKTPVNFMSNNIKAGFELGTTLHKKFDNFINPSVAESINSSPSHGSISTAPFSNINQDKLKQELAQANLEGNMKEAEHIARESANTLNDVLTQQDTITSELEKVKKNSKPRVILKD